MVKESQEMGQEEDINEIFLLFTFDRKGVRIDTPVITPMVPSEPINSCFKSNPVLSFRKVDMLLSTVPFANTTSSPSTVPCNDPYRSNRRPPAFVAMLPPI